MMLINNNFNNNKTTIYKVQ